jgi:hypothetical protein
LSSERPQFLRVFHAAFICRSPLSRSTSSSLRLHHRTAMR